MMKKAVAYARFSSENQCTESIDAQLRAIRAFAKDNDIVIVGEYIDQAKSGTNADREDFQKMLNDAKSGDFDIISAFMCITVKLRRISTENATVTGKTTPRILFVLKTEFRQ